MINRFCILAVLASLIACSHVEAGPWGVTKRAYRRTMRLNYPGPYGLILRDFVDRTVNQDGGLGDQLNATLAKELMKLVNENMSSPSGPLKAKRKPIPDDVLVTTNAAVKTILRDLDIPVVDLPPRARGESLTDGTTQQPQGTETFSEDLTRTIDDTGFLPPR